MQRHPPSTSDLNIARWRDDVANTIRTRKPPERLGSTTSDRSSRSIGPSQPPVRPAFAPIPSNAQRYSTRLQSRQARDLDNKSTELKRKRAMEEEYKGQSPRKHGGGQGAGRKDMDTTRRGEQPPEPRGRGRPRKPREELPYHTTTKVPLREEGQSSSSVGLKTNASKSTSRSRSRSGRNKTFEQPKSIGSIDMRYLEICDPPVYLRRLEGVIAEYGPLPQETRKLFNKLNDVPDGAIPFSLKVSVPLPFWLIDLPKLRKRTKRMWIRLESPRIPHRPANIFHPTTIPTHRSGWLR